MEENAFVKFLFVSHHWRQDRNCIAENCFHTFLKHFATLIHWGWQELNVVLLCRTSEGKASCWIIFQFGSKTNWLPTTITISMDSDLSNTRTGVEFLKCLDCFLVIAETNINIKCRRLAIFLPVPFLILSCGYSFLCQKDAGGCAGWSQQTWGTFTRIQCTRSSPLNSC